jgi:nucleoid-associated protein YejK
MKKPTKKSRRRLPVQPLLLMDAKLVNLMRYHQMLVEELKKPQKKLLYVASMMGELSEVQSVIAERLAWLFNQQYPAKRFDWGKIKSNSTLSDDIPESLRPERKLSAL